MGKGSWGRKIIYCTEIFRYFSCQERSAETSQQIDSKQTKRKQGTSFSYNS